MNINATLDSTEQTRHSGSMHETESLLYMLGQHEQREKFYYFVVDYLNDLSIFNVQCQSLWDLQSKGNASLSPNQIGRDLVTLYKNFMNLTLRPNIVEYILSVKKISQKHLINNDQIIFGFDNFNKEAQSLIKTSFKHKLSNKKYTEDLDINRDNIDQFLNNVHFLILNKQPRDYIKEIIPPENRNLITNTDYFRIYTNIRNLQSSLKDSSNLNKKTITRMDQFLKYNRYTTADELKQLIIQRFIGYGFQINQCPKNFEIIAKDWEPNFKRTRLMRCQNQIVLLFSTYGFNNAFWNFFGKVINLINDNKNLNASQINEKLLPKDFAVIPNLSNPLTRMYFIAILMDYFHSNGDENVY